VLAKLTDPDALRRLSVSFCITHMSIVALLVLHSGEALPLGGG
jgi:hypothetical protein